MVLTKSFLHPHFSNFSIKLSTKSLKSERDIQEWYFAVDHSFLLFVIFFIWFFIIIYSFILDFLYCHVKCNIFYFVPSYKCVLHHSRHLSILDSNLISTRDWVISNYRNFVFLLGEGGSFAKIWVRLVSLGEGWDFQIFWVSLMLLGEVHFPWVRVIPLCPLWSSQGLAHFHLLLVVISWIELTIQVT